MRSLTLGLVSLLFFPLAGQGQRPPLRELGSRQSSLSQLTERLALEMEHLQEDLAIEVPGQEGRQLYQQANDVLQEVHHFQAVVRRGASQEHLHRDYASMDRKLHQFLNSMQGRRLSSSLERGVRRVNYADQQIHYAINVGERAPANPQQEVIARQAHALDDAAQDLASTANYALTGNRAEREAQAAIRQFAQDAQHFHKTFEKGADREHLRRDFQSLDRSWRQAVQQMNELNPARTWYLRLKAQRVDSVYGNLHSMLRLEAQRPRLHFEN